LEEEIIEHPIMSFFYDENSPSGVGFETIDELTNSEEIVCMAIDLATRISDTLPEEAKAIMHKEQIPIFRLFTDNKGFWGEWCNSDTMDVDQEMNKLLDCIAKDLEKTAKQS
jgi:hypothetical protein